MDVIGIPGVGFLMLHVFVRAWIFTYVAVFAFGILWFLALAADLVE